MKERYEPSAAQFHRYVKDHKMTVHLNDGLHRHLTFSKPRSSAYHFNLVTWPGYLSVTGDLDAFTFCRTADMFEFFRQGATINAQYWAEKIVSTAKGGGHRRFSIDRYREALKSDFKQWSFKNRAQRNKAWAAIEDDIDGIYHGDEFDPSGTIRAAVDYECPISKQRFNEFWDHSFEDYTYHYILSIRAIRWGIEQFDKAHAQKAAA